MKFVVGGLILLLDAILWLLPVSGAIQSFRTDKITNNFIALASVSGNATATLSQNLYNSDTSLVMISSNNTGDAPVVGAYDDGSKQLIIAGLIPNESALLTVNYFVDGFAGQAVWPALLAMAPYTWLLILIILPIIAIFVVWKG
jgi:hypothetical protein